MQILGPSWNPRQHYYSFLLAETPVWIQESDLAAPAPDVRDISGLLLDFIEGTTSHFMSPIHYSTLIDTLEHVWMNWDEHVASVPPANSRDPIRITWRPREMRVSANLYTLLWEIESIEKVPVRIPPGFGQPAPTRTVTLVSPEQDLGLGLLEATADEIPFDQEEVPATEADQAAQAEQAAEKKRVRQARLKASLAKLKAEKLASRYLEKYGDLDGFDSSLSSDSDLGKI